MREKRERVKKGSGSSVNKKRGRDVRWRRGSVREKKESAAKQSNELMCQCVRVTALSFIYIECVRKVSNTVIYAYVENRYRGRFCTHTRRSGASKKSSGPEKHTSASKGSSSDASKRSGSVVRERRRRMQEKHESGTSAIDCSETGLLSKCQPSS